MKLPNQFYRPLAIGAPAPLRELPVKVERMIHFVPPHLEKFARQGSRISPARSMWCRQPRGRHSSRRQGSCALWLYRDGQIDRFRLHGAVDAHECAQFSLGARRHDRDRRRDRKQTGCSDVAQGGRSLGRPYLDQLLAQLEARNGVTKPILIHAILETAEGVKNVDAIASCSPVCTASASALPTSPPRAP